jgi:hypothetical protein
VRHDDPASYRIPRTAIIALGGITVRNGHAFARQPTTRVGLFLTSAILSAIFALCSLKTFNGAEAQI